MPSLVRQFSLIPPNCHILRGERNRQPIRLDGTMCDWRNRRQPWRWMRRSSHSHWRSGGNGGFAITVFAASVAVCSLALAAFSEAFAAVTEVDASPALAV